MSKYTVDPNSPLPRYYQVYVSVEERIHAGEFAPGEAIPPDRFVDGHGFACNAGFLLGQGNSRRDRHARRRRVVPAGRRRAETRARENSVAAGSRDSPFSDGQLEEMDHL